MGIWDSYKLRITAIGETQRDRQKSREISLLQTKLPNSLSYKKVSLSGEDKNLVVIKTTKTNTKKIHALPGEKLVPGWIFDWSDNKWLVTSVDPDNEIYQSGEMQLCNYKLKWVNPETREIIERWCVIEDGTTYLVGEQDNKIISVGDARFSMVITKDTETDKLDRNYRFLIDNIDAESVLAYKISKPDRLFGVYNDEGIYRFVLTEVAVEKTDNTDLMIADYYKYWDLEKVPEKAPDPTEEEIKNVKDTGVWF